jgi:hypothetical protein
MEDVDGSEDTQLKKALDDEGKSRHETQNKGEGFNWLLPLFGAIGFGVGFAYRCAIWATMVNIAQNYFADIYPSTRIGPEIGMLRGIIVGAIGGGALGLAFKDKINALYFSLTGAIGFAIAFALVISIDPSIESNLGYSFTHDAALANGLGVGAIVGAIGGLVLGLASAKNKILYSLLLCFTGAMWFAIAFALGNAIKDGCSSWNGWGGAIGGALFGITLAQINKISD